MTVAATLRAANPIEFYREHLKHDVRPNGRALMRARRPQVASGNAIASADGSALLRLGQTSVIVGVQCEPVAPAPEETDSEESRGRIVVSIDLPAICSPAAAGVSGMSLGGAAGAAGRSGQVEREKAVLTELLQRTASDGLVDLTSLLAVKGHAVWSCHCDVVVLEHDGNLADAALLAMMVALSRVRLPRCKWDEEHGALVVEEERALPLSLATPLYPSTFAMVGGSMLFDPTAEEESLATSLFTLMLDASGELRSLHKPGGAPLPDGSLEACVQAAQQRLPLLAELISSSASKDDEK